MAKRLKLTRPKPVTYLLIAQTSDDGKPMYERLYAILDEHHEELSRLNVRIALAWATSWNPDVDGRLMLGKCKRATDLDRELAPFDFVILLNREFWENPRVTDPQRQAILDHELMHAAVAYDENGDPKVDARGRTVYRIRKHDLEEFSDIAARHGCWKRDIEAFAQALSRAERQSEGWIGYTVVYDALKMAAVDVATDVIATWSEHERHEAMTWALLRHEAEQLPGNISMTSPMPACVAAALNVMPECVGDARH